ncbi:hypothetical protein BALH_4526 [Bacillus thuringiensis str. Al Hakam]|nr:hypothetical protein BALH_4526 [Bacillus thuringiensis str. Al Hakam]
MKNLPILYKIKKLIGTVIKYINEKIIFSFKLYVASNIVKIIVPKKQITKRTFKFFFKLSKVIQDTPFYFISTSTPVSTGLAPGPQGNLTLNPLELIFSKPPRCKS